jgi:hypothetical protein
MGLKVKTTNNLPEVLAKLDRIEASIRDAALPIALNKLGPQARTVGVRKVADIYGIGARDLTPYLDVRQASTGALEWVLTVKGKGLPLSLFKPRQTRKGVSVTIKGRRIVIPHSFLKAIRGNLQVWARGTYGAEVSGTRSGKRRKRGIRERTGQSAFQSTGEAFGRFAFGRNRFPISLLRSTTPPAAISNRDVIAAMNDRIREQAPKVLLAAIKFAASRA